MFFIHAFSLPFNLRPCRNHSCTFRQLYRPPYSVSPPGYATVHLLEGRNLARDSVGIISFQNLPILPLYYTPTCLPQVCTQFGSINIQMFLRKKRPSWRANQRPEIIFIFLAVIGSAILFAFITSIEQWQPLRLPRLSQLLHQCLYLVN